MHFYSYHRILSYNCPVNILIGERGCGKSYGAKKYVINKFLKKHHKFLYLRRYDNEIKTIFEKDKHDPKDFFDDIKSEYPNINLNAKHRKFYINNEVFGYAKRMTEAQDLKSSIYKDVKTIILDEYPIEKNKRYYLPDEGMILMSIFDSIIRNRNDVKIFILGNAVDDIEYSPLFSFFNLKMPFNNDIKLFKENTILLQYMNNENFRKDRENTLIGKLAKGTKYETYALKNQITNKNNKFIAHKTGSSKFTFAFIYEGTYYGVWSDYKEGKIFISFDYDKYSPYIFAVTLEDFNPNIMLISLAKKYKCWKNFINFYKMGLVYFENQKIKKVANDVINLFLT